MENENIITLDLRLTRKKAFLILTVFFLGWHPGLLGSETLVMTTFYPAPYGGYAALLSTGQTMLARDLSYVMIGSGYNGTNAPRDAAVKLEVGGGSISASQGLKWGTDGAALNNIQGGSIELGGPGGGTPYVNFNAGAAGLRMTQPGLLSVVGDLSVTGTYKDICLAVSYASLAATCPVGYNLMSRYGDGVPRVNGFLPQNSFAYSVVPAPGTWVHIGQDWAGTMICCKIDRP
jgi:hypothetical protein